MIYNALVSNPAMAGLASCVLTSALILAWVWFVLSMLACSSSGPPSLGSYVWACSKTHLRNPQPPRRYFVRVTVSRNYHSNNVKEQDFLVQKVEPPPTALTTIKMEVGIEECLHIEFEYNQQKYHMKDIIIGKVYFLLVRIKIKHMELNIIRREQGARTNRTQVLRVVPDAREPTHSFPVRSPAGSGSGGQQYNESETLTKFELMDGAPVRGECIPIRLFMSNLDLTPTYKAINVGNACSWQSPGCSLVFFLPASCPHHPCNRNLCHSSSCPLSLSLRTNFRSNTT